MKVKIFTALNSVNASARLIDELGEKNTPDSAHVFIVPDSFTLSYETEILKRLNLAGAFNIDVLSFQRCSRKFMSFGEGKVLSPEAGVMLLRKVIENCTDKLGALKYASKRVEFASDMYAVLTDLRNMAIDGKKLVEVAERAGGASKLKAKDIALINDAYTKELASGYSDGTTLMNLFARKISEIGDIKDKHFYFADFYDFSAVQFAVVRELIKYGASASFAVPVKKTGGNRRLYPNELPNKIRELALSVGAEVEIIENKTQAENKKLRVADGLFAYSGNVGGNDERFLSAYALKNPRAETFFIAKTIRDRVDSGLRYKDFAVVSANPSEYIGHFEEACSAFGIPYFADVKKPLSETPLARFLLAFLNFVRKNMRRQEALEFMCEAYAGFEMSEFSIFADYCVKYNIEYVPKKQFSIADENYPLDTAESVRARLCEYFALLSGNAITNSKRAEVLLGLLEKQKEIQDDINLPPVVLDSIRQAPEKLRSILDDFKNILGDFVCDTDTFLGIFASAVESVKLAFIPQRIDTIFIGDAVESRYSDIKVMFVCGVLPKENSRGGLISAADEVRWNEFGLGLNPVAARRNTVERFIIKEILEKPSDELVITRAVSGADGKPRLAGQVYNSLCELYGICEKTVDNSEDTDGVAPYAPRETKLRLKGLRELALSATDGKTYISPSKLENYMKCPFKHFVQYGLRLKEKEVAESSASDTGEIIHAVLELFFGDEKNYSASNLQKKAEELLLVVINRPKYRRIRESKSGIAFQAALKAELSFMLPELAKHLKRSKFKPTYTEARLGGDEFPPAEFDTDGEIVFMRGVVDRIDVFDNYAVIIDYKTAGDVAFGLRDVLFGTRLQLFLYADVVMREKKFLPTGLFYLPLPAGFSNLSGKSYYKYKGFITNDTDMYDNLDADIENSIYPIRKQGEFKASAGGVMLSESEFKAVTEYAKKVAQKATNEICGGYADIAPAERACDFCKYKGICGISELDGAERKIFKGTVRTGDFS